MVVTQDMKTFFQTIDHKKLKKRAEGTGFPMPLLRLALEAYTADRWLYTRNQVAEPVAPNRRIAPRYVLVTTLIKVY